MMPVAGKRRRASTRTTLFPAWATTSAIACDKSDSLLIVFSLKS
jgi:hypothetical protein